MCIGKNEMQWQGSSSNSSNGTDIIHLWTPCASCFCTQPWINKAQNNIIFLASSPRLSNGGVVGGWFVRLQYTIQRLLPSVIHSLSMMSFFYFILYIFFLCFLNLEQRTKPFPFCWRYFLHLCDSNEKRIHFHYDDEDIGISQQENVPFIYIFRFSLFSRSLQQVFWKIITWSFSALFYLWVIFIGSFEWLVITNHYSGDLVVSNGYCWFAGRLKQMITILLEIDD